MNRLTRGDIDVQVIYACFFTGCVDQDEADDHLVVKVGCGCDDCLSTATAILPLEVGVSVPDRKEDVVPGPISELFVRSQKRLLACTQKIRSISMR